MHNFSRLHPAIPFSVDFKRSGKRKKEDPRPNVKAQEERDTRSLFTPGLSLKLILYIACQFFIVLNRHGMLQFLIVH